LSLSLLWQQQGTWEEARALLPEVDHWLTEGVGSPKVSIPPTRRRPRRCGARGQRDLTDTPRCP
jgi:hypothetical protein